MQRPIKFRAYDNLGKRFAPLPDAVAFLKDGIVPIAEGIRLMQCTGLKDKNGVEIYEGDVVRFAVENPDMWGGGSKGLMYFDEDFAAFRINYGDGSVSINNGYDAYGGSLEVIGNVYENPELLESKS